MDVSLRTASGPVILRALVDCGAQLNLINQRMVIEHDLPSIDGLKEPKARFLDDNKMDLYKAHLLDVVVHDDHGAARPSQQLF